MASNSLVILETPTALIIDGIFNWKSLSTCSVRYQFPASVSRPLRGGCGFCVPCTCLRFCLPTVSPPWHRCVSWKTGKYTVPVGQSPLAAGCLVAPPRSWPFRVTHRAAIAHLDLNTGHQKLWKRKLPWLSFSFPMVPFGKGRPRRRQATRMPVCVTLREAARAVMTGEPDAVSRLRDGSVRHSDAYRRKMPPEICLLGLTPAASRSSGRADVVPRP